MSWFVYVVRLAPWLDRDAVMRALDERGVPARASFPPIHYMHGDDTALVLGVGLPALKSAIVERVAPLGLPWAAVVHPAATVGPNCWIGEGSYVAAGARVTVNCTTGRFVTVNMHCQVAHDDVLEDLVTLHPDTHLGGNVRVEEGAELGTRTRSRLPWRRGRARPARSSRPGCGGAGPRQPRT